MKSISLVNDYPMTIYATPEASTTAPSTPPPRGFSWSCDQPGLLSIVGAEDAKSIAIAALRSGSGKVSYTDGVFSGEFEVVCALPTPVETVIQTTYHDEDDPE